MHSGKITSCQLSLGVALIFSVAVRASTFPDYGYTPPADWSSETFHLSQQYPQTLPSSTSFPWQKIDFHTEPEKYMWAVLNYSFEGNLETDFVVQLNTVRPWYHAPWLHLGANGREFVRGLTRERSSRFMSFLLPKPSSTGTLLLVSTMT